jgi:ABC-type nickel/cobalt efflux system permease component RcnA/hydrogenase/urease accessory protein HupE
MKTFGRLSSAVFAACGVLLPATAYAHLVNTNVGEFYAGMMHPVTSSEHLLPILALALIAGQYGKHAARATLFAFPAALLAGTWAGSLLPPYGFFQVMNLILLLGLGGLLAFKHRLSGVGPTAMAALAVVTGLILGYRSGTDMAAAKVAMQFIPGVALTGLILVALIAAWVPVVSSRIGKAIVRVAGTGFALVGMLLLIQMVTGTEPLLTRSAGMPGQEGLLAMLRAGDFSASFIVATLLAAMVWGAGHALTPGHGKAIVGAYLIGARSTPWHAVYLGLTVTLTHTLGVFALGLIALFASQYVLPEQLYPWLGVLSGLIVVGMGLYMLRQRFGPLIARSIANRRDHHNHGHSHGHTGGHSHDHGHSHHAEGDHHPHTHDHDGLQGHSHHHDHHHDGYSHLHTEDHSHDHRHSRHAEAHSHHHHHVHHHHGLGDHRHHHDHHHHGHSHLHTSGHSHDHGHGHSHLPPGADGSPVTWRSLLLLGVSGGLLPCPSALVLLLAAISMNRVAFGMALVVAFSFGLAAVLTVVGLLFVKGSAVVQRVPRFTMWQRYLPVASAVIITVLGIVLMTEAAMSIGL